MPNYSVCGIDCDACQHKESKGCTGCKSNCGAPFWGECELHKCCTANGLDHCALCGSFPCDTLREWALQENPERIDNLRRLLYG